MDLTVVTDYCCLNICDFFTFVGRKTNNQDVGTISRKASQHIPGSKQVQIRSSLAKSVNSNEQSFL